MGATGKLTGWDALAGAVLVLCTAGYAALFVDLSRPPYEDAAMLMRYAQHLGGGHGIVWNVGQKPVDGATDFLFMVAVAGLVRVGMSVETAVRGILLVAHGGNTLLLYAAARCLYGRGRALSATVALYFCLGPGLTYVEAYFGTPLFALIACITCALAIRLRDETAPRRTALGFAVSSLALGLARPEGVFLAGFLLLGVVWYKGGLGRARRDLAYFGAVFAVLGGAFFVWRWSYFGYPLPNPFYKKGGGSFHLAGLRSAVKYACLFCAPLLPLWILGLRSRAQARRTAFILVPVVGFTMVWVLLSPAMNFQGRFQYAIFGIMLLWAPGVFQGLREDLRLPKLGDIEPRKRAALCLALGSVLAALLYKHHDFSRVHPGRDSRLDMGRMLAAYAPRNYTLATSEAGLVPLYSKWNTIDAWGLNDQWITHHGEVTEAYLDRFRPHVIVFRAPWPVPGGRAEPGTWRSMIATLSQYARARQYALAAAFGADPRMVTYYFVRGDFPDSGEIIEQIRSLRYYCFEHEAVCTNFALPGDDSAAPAAPGRKKE